MGGDFPNETLHTSASESDGQASNGLRIEAHGGHGSDRLHGDNLADALYGDEGSDRLFGYGGNDILAGGPGYDSLTGGSGADRFVFLDGDAGVTVNQFGTFVQTDTIMDFNQADGDVLDLADLLSGLGGLTEDGASLAAFADVMLDPLDSNNTIITVDSDNDGTFDFNIKLSGVDLIGSGAPSADIFQALIDGGNLDIV